MGFSKAKINVHGEPLGSKLARELSIAGWEPTILGREPILDYSFLADVSEYAGPLNALKRFEPAADLVFVLSCDLPLFCGEIPALLEGALGESDAVIPKLEGRIQPLCALYRAVAFDALRSVESQRVMDWIACLNRQEIGESELLVLTIDPQCLVGVNTPEEFARLVNKR